MVLGHPAFLLRQLATLPQGSTMCPGMLARRCRTTLRVIRPDLITLAHAGEIVISQRGLPVPDFNQLRGPFRVRLASKPGHPSQPPD